jgi:hypothetical protein
VLWQMTERSRHFERLKVTEGVGEANRRVFSFNNAEQRQATWGIDNYVLMRDSSRLCFAYVYTRLLNGVIQKDPCP